MRWLIVPGAGRGLRDDPKYASWFIKFKDYNASSSYPGGPTTGKEHNNSYHVPACDFYNNGTAPRCSGFCASQSTV